MNTRFTFLICMFCITLCLSAQNNNNRRHNQQRHPIMKTWVLMDSKLDIGSDSEEMTRLATTLLDSMMRSDMKAMLNARMTFGAEGLLNVRFANGMDNDMGYILEEEPNIKLIPSHGDGDLIVDGVYQIENNRLKLTMDLKELGMQELSEKGITLLWLDITLVLNKLSDIQ